MKEIFESKLMVGFIVLMLSLIIFGANNTEVEVADNNDNEIAYLSE